MKPLTLLIIALLASLAVDARAQTPPLTVRTSSVAVSPGDTLRVAIEAGSSDAPVSDLFGASFVLAFSDADLEFDHAEAGGFIARGTNPLFFPTTGVGHVAVGVSRTAGSGGVSGQGSIADLVFLVSASTLPGTKISLNLSQVAATDPVGNSITMDRQDSVVEVVSRVSVDSHRTIPQVSFLEAPYPNPTHGGVRMTVELAEAATVKVEVLDLLGRRHVLRPAAHMASGAQQLAVSLSGLAPGPYWAVVTVDGGGRIARGVVKR